MSMLRVGSRPSPLAIKQADELKKTFPWVNFEVVIIPTLGDKDKITPLTGIEGSDFFTREIDRALLEGEIDLALHSSKDLPDKFLYYPLHYTPEVSINIPAPLVYISDWSMRLLGVPRIKVDILTNSSVFRI